jgi:hypothetical protein
MRRPHGALFAFALAVLASPAAAAEITRVASSGEPGDPFDVDISIRWDRTQERATITREAATANDPGDELRFVRTRNALVPRVAIGLWKDVEIHFALPYVLADDREWRFGLVYGHPSGGVPGDPSTIEANPLDADGLTGTNGGTCDPGPCPLFPVAPSTTVFHGGRAGDLEVGLAWGIFNDAKDDTKPFWLVGMNLTFPTSQLYEPALNRGTDWSSPHDAPAKPGPFGEKIWKWDLYTVLSRRMGYIDPYVKAHATAMFKSSSTYSNCDYVDELTDPARQAQLGIQMSSDAAEGCALLGAEADAKLPWMAGVTFGTEVVPYEDQTEMQRVALDFRLFADYTSAHRFYNELTDASGKLHQTEGFLTMGGMAGLYLRASRFVSLQATASLATRSAHWLTGETDPSNPNFDWRYDAPGRRFRISEVSLFELGFAGVLQF